MDTIVTFFSNQFTILLTAETLPGETAAMFVIPTVALLLLACRYFSNKWEKA